MSGRERSKEGSFLEILSWILLLPPFSFLQLSYSVLFLPFCLSLCHYPFSLCHFYPHSVCALYLSLRGFHLDLQTPPPGATLITYGGNRKCGLKSKLKWDFHYRLLIFWWQYQGSYFLNIFSSSLCSASFLLMKRNDVISTSNPHFLDLSWLHLGQSDLCVHLKWEVQRNADF